MSGPIGVKPTRTDADIRADLAELARWVNARDEDRDEDPTLLLFALATDVEPLLFRATMAEARLEPDEEMTYRLAAEHPQLMERLRTAERDLAKADAILREYMVLGPVDDLAAMRDRLAKVRALLAHAKNVSPSQSMTVYVTDLEAALEGRT